MVNGSGSDVLYTANFLNLPANPGFSVMALTNSNVYAPNNKNKA